MYKIYLISTLLTLFGGYTTSNIENYIKEIVGTELKIDLDQMLIGGNNGLHLNDLNKPFKIIVYSDSSHCNACDIKFPAWKIQHRELTVKNKNIGLIFIINTENMDEMEQNANVAGVPGLRLYDAQGVFKKNNRLHSNRDLHTFLIDRNNKVILVGNPLTNYKVFALFKKATES